MSYGLAVTYLHVFTVSNSGLLFSHGQLLQQLLNAELLFSSCARELRPWLSNLTYWLSSWTSVRNISV